MITSRLVLGALSYCGIFYSFSSFAITNEISLGNPGAPVSMSMDVFRRDADKGIIEGEGNVFVSFGDSSLTANIVTYDIEKEILKASGNVILIDGETTIYAKDMTLHVPSRTGWMNFGRVNSPKYTLQGRQLQRTDSDQYKGLAASYSTCRDCPRSWLIASEDLAVTREEYAFMHNSFLRIFDYPVLYFPFLVFPVKRERQSGLLLPEISGSSTDGLIVRQPLFITLGESADMTLLPGRMSRRGLLLDGQFRWVPQYDNFLNFDWYFISDKIHFSNYDKKNRYRGNLSAYLGSKYYFKANIQGVSDNRFPVDFNKSGPGEKLPVLRSYASVGRQTEKDVLYLDGTYYEDLLDTDPSTGEQKPNEIANRTVNRLPRAGYYRKSKSWVDRNFFLSHHLFYDRLDRGGIDFIDLNQDEEFNDNDFVREAGRLSYDPSISRPLQAGAFRIDPRFTLMNRLYDVRYGRERHPYNVSGLLQVRNSLTFEKVYRYDHFNYDAFKHKIGPFVEYQLVPFREKKKTDFFNFGPFVDEERVDEHVITPGFLQTIISRRSTNLLSIGDYVQTIQLETKFPVNIRTYNQIQRRNSEGGNQASPYTALGPLTSRLGADFDTLKFNLDHEFYQGTNQHTLNTTFKYQFENPSLADIWYREVSAEYRMKRLSAETAQESLKYGFRYPWRRTLLFQFDQEVGLAGDLRHKVTKEFYQLTYQHYSDCWRMILGFERDISQGAYAFTLKFPLNLTGSYQGLGNKKVLIQDHNDSFSYNIREWFARDGWIVDVVEYPSYVDAEVARSYDLVVLGPGPGVPGDYPLLNFLSSPINQPLLGICLGFQGMMESFGYHLRALEPKFGVIEDVCFSRFSRKVCRYHAWGVLQEDVRKSSDIHVLGVSSSDKSIQAFVHRIHPWVGIQFHPESIGSQISVADVLSFFSEHH